MTEPRVMDPIATELAGSVLLALIEAYDDPAWGALPPCAAGLVSGASLVADHCCDYRDEDDPEGEPCEGQLTVRVANSWPTLNFPNPHTGPVTGCESWGVELEVAVMRCSLLMDTTVDPPRPPSMAAEMAQAERQLGDIGLLRHTLVDYAKTHGNQALVLGGMQPMGPEGGCTGGAITCTFLVE